MIVGSFSMLPTEKRDFQFDWSARLSSADSLATSTITANDAALVLSNKIMNARDTTFFAIGGVVGTAYTVTNHVTTAAGLILDAQISISVSSLMVSVNSYATLDEADAYFAARGNAAWMAGDLSAREAALIRASDHIRYAYVANLTPAYNDTLSIIKPAAFEAAVLELSTPNLFAGTYTPSQQKVLTGVGDIKWTPVSSNVSGFDAAMPKSAKIEAMFAPYVFSRHAPFFGMRSVGG